MVSARARRLQVSYVSNRGVSARHACALLSVPRSTLGDYSRMAAKDEPVRATMQSLSGQYPQFGYRRIRVFLERRGWLISTDRAYRIWSAAGLQAPKKRPRRRIACSRLLRTGSRRMTSCSMPVPTDSSQMPDGDR
jgi:putative transposase